MGTQSAAAKTEHAPSRGDDANDQQLAASPVDGAAPSAEAGQGVSDVGPSRGYIAQATSQDWNTARDTVKLLHRFFNGPPDLDPCSNPSSVVGAATEILLPKYRGADLGCRTVEFADGLFEEWTQYGRTAFVNPPFKQLAAWAAKCAAEGRAGLDLVLILPPRTETAYWHDHVLEADALSFPLGRVEYVAPPGIDTKGFGAGAASCFAYWGPNVKRFTRLFGGWVVLL